MRKKPTRTALISIDRRTSQTPSPIDQTDYRNVADLQRLIARYPVDGSGRDGWSTTVRRGKAACARKITPATSIARKRASYLRARSLRLAANRKVEAPKVAEAAAMHNQTQTMGYLDKFRMLGPKDFKCGDQ